MYYKHGGERGPVTFPAFKAGDSALRGSNGGFDFHTLPPLFSAYFVEFLKIVPFLYDSFNGRGAQNSLVERLLPRLHPRVVVLLGDFTALVPEENANRLDAGFQS